MLVSDTGCCAQKMMKHSKKTGCVLNGRTLPSQFTIRFVDNNRELHIANRSLRIALLVKLAIKATDDSDMYNRAFPVAEFP